MNFPPWFSPLERIQALQRWVLVMCEAYYELNENIVSDYDYDMNCNDLFKLMDEHPHAASESRYAVIFKTFLPGCTSGFELVRSLQVENPELYSRVVSDAQMALSRKKQTV